MPTRRQDADPDRPAGSVWPTALMLIGFTLIALALRLPGLSDSLWGDELATNFDVYGFGAGSLLHIVEGQSEGTPPLFFLLTSLTKGLGKVEGLRVISLAAGLASVPVVYLVGTRTVGVSAATVGTALLVFSPFQIYYATEARAYALVMFLCLVATLTMLEAVKTGAWWWWASYALSMAAAMYTHYTAVFVLAVVFGWAFVLHPAARRALLLSGLAAVVLFVPWLGQFSADNNGPAAKIIEVLIPFTYPEVKHNLAHWAIGNPNVPLGDVPGGVALWLIGGALALGLVRLLLAARDRRNSRRPSPGLVLVVLIALAVPVGASIHQLFYPSVFSARNLITSWPGFALSVGALVTAGRGPIRWIATGMVVAGFAIGGLRMLDSGQQRPDYNAAAHFIETSGHPGAPVVEVPMPSPGPQMPGEAGLAPTGQPVPPDRPVLELGRATIAVRLENRRRGGSAVYPPLPTPTDAQVARRAAKLAMGGTIFFLVAGSEPLAVLRSLGGDGAAFLGSLPPGFHETQVAHFRGFWPLSVHVLQRLQSAPRGQ